MRLRDKDIRGIPVETRSGIALGKLAGIVVDASEHRVAHYVVKKAHSLAKILPAEILVHVDQVVSLDAERMVVEDLDVMQEAEAEEAIPTRKATASAPSPVTRGVECRGE